MLLNVPQFVPQEVCLKCDGCCRFKEADSAWRPKVYADEVYRWRQDRPALADKIFSLQTIDSQERIVAVKSKHACQCRFFDKKDNTCKVYEGRPWECALYPFLLVRKKDDIMLSVHLACPHIQNHHGDSGYEGFLGELKDYFAREDTKKFILNSFESFDDYAGYEDEIQPIAPVGSRKAVTPENALLNQRMLLERSFLGQSPVLSTSSFANVFSWKDFFGFQIEIIEGHVCVFANYSAGCFLYIPPIGSKYNQKLIARCFAIMDKANTRHPAVVSRIENVSKEQLKYFPENKYAHYKKGDEYLYLKKDLIALRGNPYKSKRSELNQFKRNYNAEYLPFQDEMLKECNELYRRWAQGRANKGNSDAYRFMIEDNEKVHAAALKSHKELGLVGRVVKIDGKIVAYTFGYHLNSRTFCVLFEIADLSYNGLPVYTFHSFCKDAALGAYSFINVMDDFELENIQKTKISFRPQKLLATYTVKRRESA